jgi:hypothetical protein
MKASKLRLILEVGYTSKERSILIEKLRIGYFYIRFEIALAEFKSERQIQPR